ncbi:lipid droplet assembly factor 1-like [Anoplopoma fimbria]|uniref:lipid droplet assembly factor 1-like n=1 Tax=Anoplopoma fimbria TaxID=229290 RepID=UPI0023EC4855|nr:lipid droplet assembly factor 1-like [Anoplopoma fimbria]
MWSRMQQSSSSSSIRGTEFQQLCGSWATLLNRVYGDPKVAVLMDSRIGQYLSSHPFLALTVLLFGAMGALPIGIFLSFALVTIVMSAVGFVFFEVFLLFVGGLTLLCVLSGIAVFSLVASIIFNALYVTISNILSRYYPQLTKQGKVLEDQEESKESESELQN